MKETRLELEEQIMDCWGVVSDVGLLLYVEGGDKGAMVKAIQTIYEMKFQKLFDTFEKLLEENEL